MATMKDVANAAGVSITTVSLIINGKAKERRIAPETVERVYSIMKELDYRPNMSARRLRSDEKLRPTIAFYWPADYRTNILGSFLMHFQEILKELNFDCEIVIRSYENDQIEKEAEALIKNSYNGAIIGASSQKDVEYINSIETTMPIVLLNRNSERFSTVGSDNREIGLLAARLIRRKGYTEAAVFTSLRPYLATGARVQAFLNACSELGILIDDSWIFRGENSIEGGVQAAEAYCKLKGSPKMVFCDSDSMALGAMYTFNRRGLHLPENIEFMAIQFLEEEYTKYATPSITTIAMPNRSIAKRALEILQQEIISPRATPIHDLIEPEIIIRDTFK